MAVNQPFGEFPTAVPLCGVVIHEELSPICGPKYHSAGFVQFIPKKMKIYAWNCMDSKCSCIVLVFVFSYHANRAVPYVRMPWKHSKHVDLVHLRSIGDGEVLLRLAASFKSLTPCDLSLNQKSPDRRLSQGDSTAPVGSLTFHDNARASFQIHPAHPNLFSCFLQVVFLFHPPWSNNSALIALGIKTFR